MWWFRRKTREPEEVPDWLQGPKEGNGNNGQEGLEAMFNDASLDADSFAKQAPEDHVHAGTDESGNPLYLPARAHWDISGGSGSGKSVFIASILRQLIARYRDDYVCMIDLGGDPFLFNLCRAECEKVGRVFRYFTLANNFTYYFDPIAACTANTSVVEQAAIVTSGLGLWYGSGYGKGFHGSINKEEIEEALDRLSRAGIQATLHSLGEELVRGKRVRTRDISEGELRLRSMRRIPQLAISDDLEKQLTFSSGLHQATVDYFFLPTNRDETTPVSVATMAGAGLLNEATTHAENATGDDQNKRRRAHLFIDEAAFLNGARTMESKLPIARKWLAIKLIYQYRSQWYEHGRYMPDSLASNCPVRILFSATCEDDFRDLQLQSDEEPQQTGIAVTSAGLSVRRTAQEQIRPRLSRNKIREISRKEGCAFYAGSARNGDPLPFKIVYPTSRDEHERISEMPMRPEHNVAPNGNGKKRKRPPAQLNSPERKQRQEKLRKLLAKKKELESWEAN